MGEHDTQPGTCNNGGAKKNPRVQGSSNQESAHQQPPSALTKIKTAPAPAGRSVQRATHGGKNPPATETRTETRDTIRLFFSRRGGAPAFRGVAAAMLGQARDEFVCVLLLGLSLAKERKPFEKSQGGLCRGQRRTHSSPGPGSSTSPRSEAPSSSSGLGSPFSSRSFGSSITSAGQTGKKGKVSLFRP